MFLLSSLYDYWLSESLDRWSVGRWLKGRVVGGPVVRLTEHGKNTFGVVISAAHFGRGLFCYSNFSFLYIDDKEETNLITTSSHSNL